MASKFGPLPSDLVQLRPGLGILRLASLFAEARGALDDESLDAMFELMEAGVLEDTPTAEMWPELVRGLTAHSPSRMIMALRESGALPVVLPEVVDLFGVLPSKRTAYACSALRTRCVTHLPLLLSNPIDDVDR